MVNGRRFVPGGTGANSSVDLNSIPASVIERIEVLKDGASAVYGSDAVGGVVNIITRSEMEGVVVDLYNGMAGAGDGEVQDISVTTGFSSGKGRILFSAGYHERKPVWTGDRDFSVTDKSYDWEKNAGDSYSKNGSSATPEGHIIDRLGERVMTPGRQLLRPLGKMLAIITAIPRPGGARSIGAAFLRTVVETPTTTNRPTIYIPLKSATVLF